MSSIKTLHIHMYIHPVVDVMITIFCNFWQFSAKKLAFFSKPNVMIKILHDLPLFWVKNANFFLNFSAKYFKNHNIGPWWDSNVDLQFLGGCDGGRALVYNFCVLPRARFAHCLCPRPIKSTPPGPLSRFCKYALAGKMAKNWAILALYRAIYWQKIFTIR
jgi:hypothetical protein